MNNVKHFLKFPEIGQDLFNLHPEGIRVRNYFITNNAISNNILVTLGITIYRNTEIEI